ncbi:Response regulator NasT [Methylophaga frappieri]|uniref:Response regulator NasT n=1 Tax=Methylophaga frappieri (strain ATCC BAA-2434 / DSM 25690 / JAM7) TaxID=754477 RepID=I1YH27_METFJ|nr:ANTAR domain-containing protein [Methylophaga frappieri]AFJ02220.1 Response regulator NasT [Methylophaga frappieri]
MQNLPDTGAPLRTILISDAPKLTAIVENALYQTPYAVSYQANSLSQVAAAEVVDRPVMLLIVCEALSADLITLISTLLKQHPLPVVIFTQTYDAVLQQQAIQAGVSAFVVDGLQPHRIVPVLSMARSRFQHQQRMLGELQDLQTRLADRKIIDRAKGLLMQQRQCSEDEAYRLLRTTAMNKNMRLAMLAQQVLTGANHLENATSVL